MKTSNIEALKQINEFIADGKDMAELIILENFLSSNAIENVLKNKKGYAAAFSLRSDNPDLIFTNALKSDEVRALLTYSELYLIAIES